MIGPVVMIGAVTGAGVIGIALLPRTDAEWDDGIAGFCILARHLLSAVLRV